jgi:tRNA(Ile)-lysidine synthase
MEKKSQNLTLEERVLKYILNNRLIEGGQKVLVAVSGGPDSVCLLHTLYRLQDELKISLHIAHLDHRLRGPESEADACYVADLALRLGIPSTMEKRDVAAYRAEHRLSLEEAAREIRYGFLAQAARAVGAQRVAVGHTANDQAETILLHIIRGTGTLGLRGLQPCQVMTFSGSRLTVIRPLLGIRREETESYCRRLQLAPCLDTSNLSLSQLRNRVRHELMPLLQSYNPAALDSLVRLGRIAGDDLAFLEIEGEKAWRRIVSTAEVPPSPAKGEIASRGNAPATTEVGKGKGQYDNNVKVFVLDKAKFKGLAPALRRHLLRKAIGQLLGTLKDVETRHIEEVLEALDKPAGRTINLPDGLVFSTGYSCYWLGFYPEGPAPFPELKEEHEIRVPGKTEIPGWTIEATLRTAIGQTAITEQISNIKSKISNTDNQNQFDSSQEPKDRFTACFDFAGTGSRIKVRVRAKGDWFQPLGLNQPKKLSKFMVDARIPRSWRERIPVFCSPDQVIWVAGWRIDERVKVTENTREVLCLKASPYINQTKKKE